MKRILILIICLLFVVSLGACSAKRPPNITTGNANSVLPDSILFSSEEVWPDNTYTQNIPTPPGTVSWVMLHSEKESCSIRIDGITKSQFGVYYKQLLNAGYAEIKKISEPGYISIGTLLSDGRKSISLAYSESVFMMTIINEGTEGTKQSFLRPSNLANVYVNAYSTYDAENGVQVITELYAPEGAKAKPRFSSVHGMVTVTVGDATKEIYLGSLTSADAVSLAINTQMLGSSGEKGFVAIAGTVYADNAISGCGSFAVSYEITIP